MPKTHYGSGAKIFVICEVWDGGFCDEFYITLGGMAFYLNKNLVKVSDTPKGDRWVPGEITAEVIEDNGDKILVRLPLQEKILGDNPVRISRFLTRLVNEPD